MLNAHSWLMKCEIDREMLGVPTRQSPLNFSREGKKVLSVSHKINWLIFNQRLFLLSVFMQPRRKAIPDLIVISPYIYIVLYVLWCILRWTISPHLNSHLPSKVSEQRLILFHSSVGQQRGNEFTTICHLLGLRLEPAILFQHLGIGFIFT